MYFDHAYLVQVFLQLLVNKTLYEKTVASGFGSIHFLLDASEQQLVSNLNIFFILILISLHSLISFWHFMQYKEAILVYATLLKLESGQVCFIYGHILCHWQFVYQDI